MEHFFDPDKVDLLGVSITHLIAYATFTWISYIFSGALFNPAITLVLMCFRKISLPKGIFYIIS